MKQLAADVHAPLALDGLRGVGPGAGRRTADKVRHTLLVDSTTVRAHQHAGGSRTYDAARYAQRHPVEQLFSHLKRFRREAVR
jgi:hypothetical protein